MAEVQLVAEKCVDAVLEDAVGCSELDERGSGSMLDDLVDDVRIPLMIDRDRRVCHSDKPCFSAR